MDRSAVSPQFDTDIGLYYAALFTLGRGQVMGKLKTCLEAFGWQDEAVHVPLWLGNRGWGRELGEMLRHFTWKHTNIYGAFYM